MRGGLIPNLIQKRFSFPGSTKFERISSYSPISFGSLEFPSKGLDERKNFSVKLIPTGNLAGAGFFEMGSRGGGVDAGLEET